MSVYIFTFFVLLITITAYFRIARRFRIIDMPNDRSSHTDITIRGGGIIFPIAILLWFFMFNLNFPWIIMSLLLLSIVSFADDIITLSSITRIVIHFLVVAVLLLQLNFLDYPWYIFVFPFLFTAGWINTFNFMDGINGNTAFYSAISLITLTWLNQSIAFMPQSIINFLIISVIIFTFFNARKRAKTFAGDVGSVSMAFLLAWFLISLIIKTERPEYILLFAVYGIDSSVTIFIRLLKRKNIFKAHRTHLYQYLSNELGFPHITVAAIYSLIQAVINIITIKLITTDKINLQIFILILLLLTTLYIFIRLRITKVLNLKIS